MLRVLRQRNFGLLWFGGFVSMLGDFILFVGLPYEIYRLTGSTLATAGMVVSFLVPSILLGSIAGVFVDRWDRRRLMIVVNLLQSVSILPLLFVPQFGIWIIYAVLVVESSISQLFQPAQVALIPVILEGGQNELITANATAGVGRHLSRLIGPLIGGVVVATGGLAAVTILDSVSFLVSAAMLGLIRVKTRPRRAADSLERQTLSAWGRLATEWREGLRLVIHQPILRAVLVFFAITSIGEGLTGALFVVWVVDALHSDATGWGLVLATQAIGGVAGAVAIARLASRIKALPLLIWSGLTFGAIDLVLFTYPAVYPHIGPALVMLVIVGVPGAGLGAASTTLQQSMAADSHRGRVVGAIGAVSALGALVGSISAGVLGQFVPVIVLLVVQGSGYVIAATAAWLLTRSELQPAPVPIELDGG
jgi:MFS family permease